MKAKISLIATVILLGTGLVIYFWKTPVTAQERATPTPSGYANLLETEIRGMSPEQIEGYRSGSGLGMALPAELNGYPGPKHALDLAEELELTATQVEALQRLYSELLPEAVRLGEDILAGEAALEAAFRTEGIDETYLEAQLTTLGQLYAELRFVHLRTHLATKGILTPHQVRLYNQLRGYEQAGTSKPSGHSGH